MEKKPVSFPDMPFFVMKMDSVVLRPVAVLLKTIGIPGGKELV